jgi:hypothetical protein
MMELPRRTMSGPSTAFSIVAHEALDHLVADADNDECLNQEGAHIISRQRSRRRLKVS